MKLIILLITALNTLIVQASDYEQSKKVLHTKLKQEELKKYEKIKKSNKNLSSVNIQEIIQKQKKHDDLLATETKKDKNRSKVKDPNEVKKTRKKKKEHKDLKKSEQKKFETRKNKEK